MATPDKLKRYQKAKFENYKKVNELKINAEAEDSKAKVDIEVTGLSVSTYSVKNISLVNIPENCTVDIVSESIDVAIRGTEEQLNDLKAENIRAVADLADYKDSLGTYMPQVKIYVDSSVDVGAIGSYTITVVIKEQPLGGNQ